MRKKVGIIKQISCLGLVFLLSINSFAAIVSDNDGSAFITKAEFDALKSSFQSQIDTYNQSIDSKIDGAIAAYLAGMKLSSEETLATISLGTLNFQGRGSDSDDSSRKKNQALSFDYTWQYGTKFSPTSKWGVTVSYLKLTKTGTPDRFNGLIQSGSEWVYKGNKNYLVTKTDSRHKVYSGYGAEKMTATGEDCYAAYFPAVWAGTVYAYPAVNWGDFVGSVRTFRNPCSNLNWSSFQYNFSGPTSYSQSRASGRIDGAGVYTSGDENFVVSSQSYEEMPAADDYFLNIFEQSNKTFLYSLNKWDGLGFGGWATISGTSWGFDGEMILKSWNSWSDLTKESELDWNNLPWSLSATRCAKFIGLAAIFNVNWGDIYYPQSAFVYSHGVQAETKFKLTDNIPLVNIQKDGILKMPLQFKTPGTYKIWLDTEKANTFTTGRTSAICPTGKTLASDGSFTITTTTSNPIENLYIPVEKNTTVFIKWKNASDNGTNDITFDSEFLEEINQ